jgi:hypothetical protein
MPLTDSLVVVTQVLFDKFTSLRDTLELTDVFYGDQTRIPRSPCLCVESGTKTRELQGAMRRTTNVFQVYLILYHSEVRDSQTNRKEVDVLAEQVEALVHADPTLGGIVTHSYCTSLTPGYVPKASGTLFKAARITVEATTTTNLPPSP